MHTTFRDTITLRFRMVLIVHVGIALDCMVRHQTRNAMYPAQEITQKYVVGP